MILPGSAGEAPGWNWRRNYIDHPDIQVSGCQRAHQASIGGVLGSLLGIYQYILNIPEHVIGIPTMELSLDLCTLLTRPCCPRS